MNSKQAVDDYFKENPTDNLLWKQPLSKEQLKVLKHENLESAVYLTLKLNKMLESVDSTGNYQCRAGARRSSGDIWRHLKVFRDVTIYEVMQSLYSLSITNFIRCSVCGDIGKRVFKASDPGIFFGPNRDEYGIVLNDWKNING